MTERKAEIPVFTKIDLLPWEGENYYIYVIPEETQGHFSYEIWVFREGHGVALNFFGVSKEDSDMVSLDSIKKLDKVGFFYDIKQVLHEMQ